MASLKAIRRRITTARSTQQITRALKLVSAARLRRAQEALVNALPYSEALARVADSLLTSEGISVGPVEGAQKKSLLVVVASDRGLAGGYNSFLFRAAEESRREMESFGFSLKHRMVCHGLGSFESNFPGTFASSAAFENLRPSAIESSGANQAAASLSKN